MDNELLHLKKLTMDQIPQPWDPVSPQTAARTWAEQLLDAFIERLEKSDRLLPPGGIVTHEKGIRRGKADPGHNQMISRVGEAFPGRFTRIRVAWMIPGEPNSNWPVYVGPWIPTPPTN